jgi:succinate-semialdehyde dehydrogenase/glutarate-semialdehyde dehydrogenase
MLSSELLGSSLGLIDGRWVGADDGTTAPVHDRASGELLARVPVMGGGEARRAVEAAGQAMAQTPSLDQRRLWLRAIAQGLIDQRDQIGRIITLEMGKPLKEARVEAEYGATFFSYMADHLDALKPHTLEATIRHCRWTVHHRPAGVAALIVPWNFPLAMKCKKIAAALGAGCAMVTKPASLTPLSAIAMHAVAQKAGVPAGWMNLVIGRSGPIGDVLCSHPLVRIVSFTGSTEIGRRLIEISAPHVKRLSLELGGNAPFIVFDDANLDAAADALIANKFRAGGQTCVCANRIYVQRDIHDAFIAKLAPRVAALKVGPGIEPATDIGPLIDRDQWDKVAAHVADALARGATRVAGHDAPRPLHEWGAFFPPTLLTDVKPDMLVCRDETFGPVLAVQRFSREDEAIAAANDTIYGLASYVFTADAPRAQRVAAQLSFGHVAVNSGSGPTPEAPFGGMKQSGFGREGGIDGLLEYTETQTVAAAV